MPGTTSYASGVTTTNGSPSSSNSTITFAYAGSGPAGGSSSASPSPSNATANRPGSGGGSGAAGLSVTSGDELPVLPGSAAAPGVTSAPLLGTGAVGLGGVGVGAGTAPSNAVGRTGICTGSPAAPPQDTERRCTRSWPCTTTNALPWPPSGTSSRSSQVSTRTFASA